MSETTNSNVLVLNQNYEPLNITSVRRAIVLLCMGKAEAVKDDTGYVHTVDDSFRVPTVVRLAHFVKRPVPELKLSRKSILARDEYTCQYCGDGGPHNLTLDHVVPRVRGGKTEWENLVCCCLKCNNKKGNRTPQEVSMSLRHPPRKPKYVPYISFPKFVAATHNEEFLEYLSPYMKSLESVRGKPATDGLILVVTPH
ncbi:MAG: HNH endonuclease [Armatimonadetes bacterium]|nr:HNH endonuclease [Armatimonadota bacterium]PIU60882.1 MAG: HNH endonuclease [Armatimonadetes bacterium CG07_land_8_20_14_0_80_59_28]PIY44647.1 MAG: HNH endonuclease [Armatimonadetes bacterium CG_4_10_14_3_um_filter_59_10]